ncbi:MAG: hypothetical protein ACJ8KX_05120 [Chthoniobacterales bacterium]
MKLLTAALLGTLALSFSARGAIDFTPITTERVLAGVTFKELNFSDDGRRITYEQPRGWSYSGRGTSIRFLPPKLVLASATIEQTPLPEPQVFDADTAERLRARTLASVSPAGTKVTLVSEQPNPVVLNNHPTYEIIVSYEQGGERLMLSVIYLNLPATEVRFRTVARKEDFDAVHAAFRGSLFSWQWR